MSQLWAQDMAGVSAWEGTPANFPDFSLARVNPEVTFKISLFQALVARKDANGAQFVLYWL